MRYVHGRRGDTTHRYFRRRHDAEKFALRLQWDGIDVRLFQTSTSWDEIALP